MNLYEILFSIMSTFIQIGGTYYLYSTYGIVSALIFFIINIPIFIIFGLKWFGPNGSFLSNTGGSWPPYINTCPDYLTFYKRVKTNGDKSNTCVDITGVATAGILQQFPADGNVNPDNDAYFFTLIPNETLNDKCSRTIHYGLTWEGITDGQSCFSPNGPTPPTGGGSGSGSNCLQ